MGKILILLNRERLKILLKKSFFVLKLHKKKIRGLGWK